MRGRRGSGGFTLIEVAAAVTILAIGISAVLSSFSGMDRASQLVKRRTEATHYAKNLFALVRTEALLPTSEETEGEFEETDYRYKVTFSSTDFEGLYSVAVQIFWGDEELPDSIQLYILHYYD